MLFRPSKFLRRLMPSLIWELESDDEIFITFDDGPTPGNTERILETLAKYGAKGTFFCLGKNVEQHPELFQKIIDQGHAVGNHTYSHQKGWSMSLRRYMEDVDFASQFIPGHLFRPPYGRIKPMQARVLSERYDMVMWNVLSRDYSRYIKPRKCARNVIKTPQAGGDSCLSRLAKVGKEYELCATQSVGVYEREWVKMCSNRALINKKPYKRE